VWEISGTLVRYYTDDDSGKASGSYDMSDTIPSRQRRVDAQRNIDSLVESAKVLFMSSGVDVPMKEIADRAGVGVGTLYRHFPLRSDLISAVFKREIDECAAAAPLLAASHPPDAALELWLQRYTRFVATKHGLAAALHSGDPAYSTLRVQFEEKVGPALRMLLDNAVAAGVVHDGEDPLELLGAVANLCIPAPGSTDTSRAYRMVALLVKGLRYDAGA
jgi:AcrR family transcriptional regulator